MSSHVLLSTNSFDIYNTTDWRLVNRLLGSKRDVDIPDKGSDGNVVNAAGSVPVRNNLSFSSRMVLCEYLKNEIRIYVDLLNRAVNLSDDDIRSTLAVTERNCPQVMTLLARGVSSYQKFPIVPV